MLQRYKFQDLKTQIIEIQDRYPKLSPDEAFVAWYLRSYLVDSEDKAIEALRGAPHDKGVDAVYVDHDSKIIYILQGKYHQGQKLYSESRSDVVALASLGESLLAEEKNRFENLLENSDPPVKESLINARKYLHERKYRLVLQFITTGKVSNTHRKEAESIIEKWDNATFEVYGNVELSRQMQDYMEGVAPPIPSIQIPVHGQQLFNSHDETTNISAWLFTMKGRELGKLYATIGIRLFSRNIRGFLGNTEINRGMEYTIKHEPDYFWYFNNGVTIICDEAKQITEAGNVTLRLTNPQIINGQQTTRILAKHPETTASILAKVIVVPRYSEDTYDKYKHLVDQIVSATNWQNAISQSDLKSNDREQVRLERDLRKLGCQYLRKKQTKYESRLLSKNQSLIFIKKEELAKYVGACILDPYELRLGKDRLFEDEVYKKVFDSQRPIKNYLTFYWLHKIVRSITIAERRYGFAKWLVLNFLWSEIGRGLDRPHMRDIFLHIVPRQKRYYSTLRYLNKAIKTILSGAMKFYRLNRKSKGAIKTEIDFFRFKNIHISFRKYWESRANLKKVDFRTNLRLFIESIGKVRLP